MSYYPLVEIMRQSDAKFLSILMKIGDGKALSAEEREFLESWFVIRAYIDEHEPKAIRLFFCTADAEAYNNTCIQGQDVIEYVASDEYSGHKTAEQLRHTRAKVPKMTLDKTGSLSYMLWLLVGKLYVIRVNIDTLDNLVNGAIGILKYIEWQENDKTQTKAIKQLWMQFDDKCNVWLLQAKYQGHVHMKSEYLNKNWIFKQSHDKLAGLL